MVPVSILLARPAVSYAVADQLIGAAQQIISQLGGVAKLVGRPTPTRFALNLAVPLYVDQFTTAPKWVVAGTTKFDIVADRLQESSAFPFHFSEFRDWLVCGRAKIHNHFMTARSDRLRQADTRANNA